jgi:Uma2 family endonuclease
LTVDQYEALIDSGVFTERDRFTLINGILVPKLPPKRPHVIACAEVGRILERAVPGGWRVLPDGPVRLPPGSAPQPDFAVVRGTPEDHPVHPSEAAALVLVVEVSFSTLDDDRNMAAVYGAALIPVYWIINLVDRQVEVFTGHDAYGYSTYEIFLPGESLFLDIDGVRVGQIAVDDMPPPLKPSAGGNGT